MAGEIFYERTIKQNIGGRAGAETGHVVGQDAVDERAAKRALVTLCVGGGQGAALWLERM